ncbi:MAG: HEAT repeat domain-containing protein [Acetobacterium sp.]
MTNTERIDEIYAQMQQKPMEENVIQCYVTELLETKSSEGLKIILNETDQNCENSGEVINAVLKSRRKSAQLLCKYYNQLGCEQQKKAIKLLGTLQEKSAVKFLKEIFEGTDKWLAMDAVPGLRPFISEEMIPMIFDVIADSDYYRELKISCVSLLVDIGLPAVPKLLEIVADKPGVCALHAIQALGEIGDSMATEILCGCLEHSDDHKIRKAAEALGKIRDPEATLPLCKALMSEISGKDEILVALGKIGNPQATPMLIEYYNHGFDIHDKIYYMDSAFFLLEAMGKMKDEAMIEPLTRIFTRSPEKYRMTALKALENLEQLLGDVIFNKSLDSLPESIQKNAIIAWFQLGEGESKRACRKLLTSENFRMEESNIGNNSHENNALMACLLLPLGFEKENMADVAMRCDAMKSMVLFKDKAYDCLMPWIFDEEIASYIREIIERLEDDGFKLNSL